MSKGDNVRPHDKDKFDSEFERIFGKKKLNLWDQEENDEQEKCTQCEKPCEGRYSEQPSD